MSVADKVSLLLEPDLWISKELDKDVYRLNLKEETIWESSESKLDELNNAQGGPVFIYAKVGVKWRKSIDFLVGRKFRLIETNVTFEKPVSGALKVYNDRDFKIELAQGSDEDDVKRLAQRNFRYSRFHADDQIPDETANRLKGEWAANFFHGKRGDQMVVARSGGQVVGFLQLLYGDDKALVIDLIAVDKEFQKKGLGRKMIEYAEATHTGFSKLRASTQVANLPSISMYENIGFRVAYNLYVFHFHKF